MAQITGREQNEPEMIPVIGRGVFRDVAIIAPIISMGDDFIGSGMLDDEFQIVFHPCQIEIDSRQICELYIMGEIKIVLRRAGHGQKFAIKIMNIGRQYRLCPVDAMVDGWIVGSNDSFSIGFVQNIILIIRYFSFIIVQEIFDDISAFVLFA